MSPKERSHVALQAVYHALLELLKSQPENTITITMLCDRAHVSRAYYYRNFNTFEDIMEKAMLDHSLHYLRSLPPLSNVNFAMMMERYFLLVDHNREDYLLLADIGKTAAMATTFTSVHQYLLTHNRIQIHTDSNPSQLFWPEFLAGAVTNTAIAWLRDDQQVTPRQLGSMLANFLKLD